MTERFRLLTANLLRDRVDPANLATVLDRHEPDIVVTQELGPVAAGVIADRYPRHDLHPATEYKGRGIATRFDAGFGRLELPWRAGGFARIRISDIEVMVSSVHLLNPVNFPWWVTARRRGEQLDFLFRWAETAAGDIPLVVAGDMNASPIWPVYRRLAERWEDLVLAATGGRTRPAATWAWRPGLPRLLRIDHVFGRGVSAIDTKVVPVLGSDHAAVVVDLEL